MDVGRLCAGLGSRHRKGTEITANKSLIIFSNTIIFKILIYVVTQKGSKWKRDVVSCSGKFRQARQLRLNVIVLQLICS